jgi:hypothetical protein
MAVVSLGPGEVEVALKLAELKDGRVEFARDYTRSFIRANGLKFREVDIESGSPKGLQRRLARNIEDAGYNIIEDGMDAQKGGWGDSVGDISGRIIAHRDEQVQHALRFPAYPYAPLLLGTLPIGGAGFVGLMMMMNAPSLFPFLMVTASVVAGIGCIALGSIEKQQHAGVYTSTVLRIRTEGEAMETRTDEESGGKRVIRSMVSARMSVAMNVELLLAVNLGQVPSQFRTAVAIDASPFLADDGKKQLDSLRQRAADDLSEIADRVGRFSQVA